MYPLHLSHKTNDLSYDYSFQKGKWIGQTIFSDSKFLKIRCTLADSLWKKKKIIAGLALSKLKFYRVVYSACIF